jgi:hypothetical protein
MAARVVSTCVSDICQRVPDDALMAQGIIANRGEYGQVVAEKLDQFAARKARRRKRNVLADARRLAELSREEDVRTLLSDVADSIQIS